MAITHLIFFFFKGASITSVDPITPTDDDADTTVTARIDVDGNTIRPPRLTLLHAVDSARNADLHDADRLPMDRYDSTSVRLGRVPTTGHHMRIYAFTSRAGEGAPIRRVVAEIGASKATQRLVTDTTSRTGPDGETLRVATTRLFHAAESARNAALSSAGTDRDRFLTLHALPGSGKVAALHRLFMQHDGRAGNAWCPREIIVRFETVDDMGRARAT